MTYFMHLRLLIALMKYKILLLKDCKNTMMHSFLKVTCLFFRSLVVY